MGCQACSGEKTGAEGKKQKGAVERYKEGLERANEGELRLNQGNYVMLTLARLDDHYEVLEKLGEGKAHTGAFGAVYRGRHRRLGQDRAIKSLWTGKMTREQQDKVLREVALLKEMVGTRQDHPNIVKVYEVVKDGDFYHIITELLTGGELLERLSFLSCAYSESTVSAYFQQLLSAVSYLHSKRILHRDLKPDNLVFESRSKDSVLKLIDFGTSCRFDEIRPGTLVGTTYYIAPEMLSGRGYDEKCDVWSCGVILYMLLCRE